MSCFKINDREVDLRDNSWIRFDKFMESKV